MNKYKEHSKMLNKGSLTWDEYFFLICQSTALKSTCLSRKIGAILVKDKSIISTGYNGPPRGIPHCGHDRFQKDEVLSNTISKDKNYSALYGIMDIGDTCPRKLLGYESGTGMQLCPAQHAEINCISNAAKFGISVIDSILYISYVIPCKDCFGALINAGIKEIVVKEDRLYDKFTKYLINNSQIKIRKFNL